MNSLLKDFMDRMPIVAILRGIRPEECIEIIDCLLTAGICIAEVPLNSPDALTSIKKISEAFGEKVLLGAGTVLTVEQAQQVAQAGGKLIVSPNTNIEVIKATSDLGLISLPGVATPSEAFNALDAGASGLKAFPAEMIPPAVIKSWFAVLPKSTTILPVGGITPSNMHFYLDAGASGFGTGSGLYKSGKSIDDIRIDALEYVKIFKSY